MANKIDFNDKKIATGSFLPNFIKEKITAKGGAFLTEEDKIENVDMVILSMGDIGSSLCALLQFKAIEFYFMEEVIASIDVSFYDKLKKADKEMFYMNYLFTNGKGKFKGIEKTVITAIREAMANPNEIVRAVMYRRNCRSFKEFKANSKYKIGDKLPKVELGNVPVDSYDLYSSIDGFKLQSTDLSNPNLVIEDYDVIEQRTHNINTIDKVLMIPFKHDLFGESNNRMVKDYLSGEEAKELGIDLQETYFFYYEEFSDFYPNLISIKNNKVIVLTGDDYGAEFIPSDECAFVDILPIEISRNSENTEENYYGENYNAKETEEKNVLAINEFVAELITKNISVLDL